MTPDDWRAPIAALAGGDTLEAMLAFAARQGVASGPPDRRRGWTVTVGWFRSPGVYRARVYRADPPRPWRGRCWRSLRRTVGGSLPGDGPAGRRRAP